MPDNKTPHRSQRTSLKMLPCWALLLCCMVWAVQAASWAQTVPIAGRVVRVVDGDTVVLLTAQHVQVRLRLAGIDAPESNQPHGHQARTYLASLVAGQEVVAHARKLDRYGRTIAQLRLAERDVNLAMLQAGLAWHYKAYAREQPAGEALAYARAEDVARLQGIGLWQDPSPMPPWLWRPSKDKRTFHRRP